MSVIGSSIQMILARECISRSHLGARGDLLDNVEVLEKQGPPSLAARKFVRIS